MPFGPPSWLAPLSDIRNEHGVVEFADLFEEVDQPADLRVGVIEEAGERFLQAQRQRLLICRDSSVPGFDAGIARRELGVRRE